MRQAEKQSESLKLTEEYLDSFLEDLDLDGLKLDVLPAGFRAPPGVFDVKDDAPVPKPTRKKARPGARKKPTSAEARARQAGARSISAEVRARVLHLTAKMRSAQPPPTKPNRHKSLAADAGVLRAALGSRPELGEAVWWQRPDVMGRARAREWNRLGDGARLVLAYLGLLAAGPVDGFTATLTTPETKGVLAEGGRGRLRERMAYHLAGRDFVYTLAIDPDHPSRFVMFGLVTTPGGWEAADAAIRAAIGPDRAPQYQVDPERGPDLVWLSRLGEMCLASKHRLAWSDGARDAAAGMLR